MSSANRDTLTISLPICIPFISSSCLIALHQPYFYEGFFEIGSHGTICPGWLPTMII
jgi:hypothetical protein